jgi:uncharacterized membrane protein
MNSITCFVLLLFLVACESNPASDTNNAATDSTATAGTDTTATISTIPERWKEKAAAGIDFIATGNEPFWSFELDEEKSMHFKMLDGIELIAPAVAALIKDSHTKIYTAQTEKGTLIVQIEHKLCINDMSGDSSAYTVNITVKQNTNKEENKFRGCGTSLKN